MNLNYFIVCNDFSGDLLITIEPEGAIKSLAQGEKVEITDKFKYEPVTLNVSLDTQGMPIIAVWPGDGSVRVAKDGVDLLDLE